jgi:hypothetical protein
MTCASSLATGAQSLIERECVCERASVRVLEFQSVIERERDCVCVCECVCERDSEQDIERKRREPGPCACEVFSKGLEFRKDREFKSARARDYVFV